MKKLFKYIVGLLVMIVLSACGGGSIGNQQNSNPTQASLSVIAPNQYPAGVATIAYLTVVNNSSTGVSNLTFDVPIPTNFTGTSVTVLPDSAQACSSIPAHGSCILSVQIGANSKTGSFQVVASNGGTPSSFTSAIKSLFGVSAQQFILTANIGLTDIPSNTQSGADGISFLYSSNIISNSSGATSVSVVAVVNPNAGNNFNTIQLTTSNGATLDFKVLSGNSGSGSTNLAPGSIVTFTLNIPQGASSPYIFYAKTLEDSTVISQGTVANPIIIASSAKGILTVQPTYFSLSASPNNIQILTYTNTGNATISGFAVQNPQSPVSITQNDCGATIAVGSSCNIIVSSSAASGATGNGSIIANYTGANSVLSNFDYSGGNVQNGISVTSVNNFSFTATTSNGVSATKLTIKNTGNVAESDFAISFAPNQYFSLSQENGDTCILNGNTVVNTLAGGDSCVLTLTYNNNSLSAGLTSMTVNYNYGNSQSDYITQTLAWQTTASGASMSVNPSSYYYGPIIANNIESKTHTFTITNNGPNAITAINFQSIMGFASYFTLESGGVGGCASAVPLANGATCTFNINFGPSQIVNPQITATLPIAYTYSGGSSSTSVALSGYSRSALSANIQLYNVVSNSGIGNGESVNSAFQFESASATSKTITLSYQNNGQTAAQNFSISQAPSGYSILSNSCNNITLNANSANSCNVVLQPNNPNPGNINISLTSSILYGSWSDERGTVNNQTILWSTATGSQNIIYANIYASPQVKAVLSSESSSSTPITQVATNGNFYVVLTLTGGYNVDASYTVTAPQGFSPTSANCTVTSYNPQCNVAVTAPDTVTSGAIISISGGNGVNVTPSSLSINVVAAPAKTTYAYLSTGSTGIFQCSVSESDGMLNNCVKKGDPNPAPGNIVSLAMYPTGDYLYALTNTGSLPTDIGSYYACPLGQNGQYESATCGQKSFPAYGSLAFAPTNGTMYGYLAGQPLLSSGNQPNYCTIVQESTLFCNTRSSYPTLYSRVVSSMVVNGSSYVYMSSVSDSKIYACDVTNTAGYVSPNCPSATGSTAIRTTTISNIQIGADYYAYIVNQSGSSELQYCKINSTGGSKGLFENNACVSADPDLLLNVSSTTEIATSTINGKPYLYAYGNSAGQVSICSISTDSGSVGSLVSCSDIYLDISTTVGSMVFGSY